MASNLEIQLQLNKALQDALAIMDSQMKTMQAQSGMLQAMVKLQEASNRAAGKIAASSEDVAKALEDAEKASSKLGDVSLDRLNEQLDRNEKTAKDFTQTLNTTVKSVTALKVGQEGLRGFAQGFSFLGNTLKTVGGLLLSTMNVVGQFAASIVSFPFKLLSGLIKEADNLSGDTSLATELENIRKEFGYLNKTAGGAVTSLAKSMSGELANTGLSVFRVFGRLHERLAYFREYFTALGPIADNVITKIGEGGAEALGAYNKALGLTAEGQRALATRALATGQTVNELNRQVANYAMQLSSRFGVTMKAISRQMGEMMADFENFGHMAPQELAQVAVYARKLGIEVKSLAAVMNKSFNFEDAANQAAQLSQAFGITVDALQQVTEQDPARKMDNLRKAFFAAGRSIESMTIQERRLLSQQTGLEGSALDLAFSLKNQGLSYADVQKKGDAAKKSQISQAEALQKLAGAIERQVQALQKLGSGSFFDRFIQGINAGIRRSRDFRTMIWDIRRDLNATFREGMRVGRDLVRMFPGIQEMFDGIKEMFNPRIFRQMLHSVRETFAKFFKDMTDNPQQALGKLMESLRKNFFDWFDSRGEGGRKLISGMQNFFKAFASIVNSGLRLGLQGLTSGIRTITDLLTGRQTIAGLLSGGGGAGGAAIGFLRPIFERLMEGLSPAFAQLWNAIKDLGSVLWERFKRETVPWLKQNVGMLFALVFGPPVVASISRMVATSFIGGIAHGVGSAVASSALNRLFKSASQTVASRMPDTSGAASTIRGAGDVSQAAQRSSIRADILPKLALIAGVIGIGIVSIYGAVQLVKRQNLSVGDIGKAALMLTGAVPLVLASAAVVAAASLIPANVGPGIVVALSGMALVAVGALYFAKRTVQEAKGFQIDDFRKAAAMLGVMGTLLGITAAGALAAIGVGALMVASGGTGAVAVAAGLATLGLIAEAMVQHGMTILKRVASMQVSSGYENKIKAFVDVTKAIGEFAKIFGEILAATRPSFLSVVRGNSKAEIDARLGGVKTLVETIGTQLSSLIGKFNELSSSLTPEQINRGRFLIDVVTAVSGFSRGMAGPVEMLRDTSAWWQGSDVNAKINAMNDFVAGMSANIIRILRTIGGLLTNEAMSGTNGQSLAIRGQVISNLLGTVGEFATKLQPPPSVISALNTASPSERAGLLTTLADYVHHMAGALASSQLLSGIGNFITQVLTSVAGIPADSIAKIQAVSPIISSMFTAMGGFFQILQNITVPSGGNAKSQAARIQEIMTRATEFAPVFTTAAGGLVSTVLNQLSSFVGTLNEGRVTLMRNALPTVQAVFQFLGTIPSLITSLSSSASNSTNASGVDISGIRGAIAGLNSLLDALVGSGPGSTSNSSDFGSVISRLGRIQPVPRGVMDNLRQVVSVFQSLKTASDSFTGFASAETRMTEVATSIGSMRSGLQRVLAEAGEDTGILGQTMGTIGSRIARIVQEVNAVNTEIARLQPININASLQTLTNNIGLGQTAEFRINRGSLNIQLNADIKIIAQDLEEILLNRTDSRIAVVQA